MKIGFLPRQSGKIATWPELALKVSKFQKQIFCSHFLQKMNEIFFLISP